MKRCLEFLRRLKHSSRTCTDPAVRQPSEERRQAEIEPASVEPVGRRSVLNIHATGSRASMRITSRSASRSFATCIHRNPVKRGLVEKPEDWQRSSFRRNATGVEGCSFRSEIPQGAGRFTLRPLLFPEVQGRRRARLPCDLSKDTAFLSKLTNSSAPCQWPW
jgi:hypothetical protein